MKRGRPTKRNAMVIEEAREKIRTTQLINRLQNHVLGEVKMTVTQVRATEILLSKCIPDLKASELTVKNAGLDSYTDAELDQILAHARAMAIAGERDRAQTEGPGSSQPSGLI